MNSKIKIGLNSRLLFRKSLSASLLAAFLLLPFTAHGAGVVTKCTEADLRAALAGGGTVTFTCDGTITLAAQITVQSDTVLDAAGHQVTISGGNAVRVLQVKTNIVFTLANLVIAHGLSTNGGGVYNEGGTVAATNCVFTANSAIGANGTDSFDPDGKPGRGGAIYSSGLVRASQCTFSDNSARGGNGVDAADESGVRGLGGAGRGGAIYNLGQVSVTTCTFQHNYVYGGAGGTSTSEGISFVAGPGGEACGGAIFSPGTLNIGSSLFSENAATGGAGGNGRNSPNQGWGLGLYNDGGIGGNGGAALGALYAGSPSFLINCTLAGNQAQGGAGGTGGNGGFYLDMGSGNYIYGSGGSGGYGGDAQAAIYDPAGMLWLTNCTVASNAGSSGAGGVSGRNGGSSGGGSPSPAGIPRGALLVTNAVMINTIVAANSPTNCGGTIVDAGRNLSSDGSCAFTNVGSLNNTDPLLGPLADNGGPTLTMALLPGSPAIDAGDTAAAPPMDQRGFPRPAGPAADIGAFEYGSMLPMLAINRLGGTELEIVVCGNSNRPCRMFASSDWVNWQCVATNQIGPDGTILFQDNCGDGESQRFYRVTMP